MPLLAIGFFKRGRRGAWGVFERRRERTVCLVCVCATGEREEEEKVMGKWKYNKVVAVYRK
jgi:hypothetical protein